MGVSTNGIICYGISFEEDFEFPWDDDWDEWWIKICGYKPLFEMYDEKGEYIAGMKPAQEDRDKYWDHKYKFKKEHPMPVEIVTHCSGDYPMYIIAIPRTVMSASRGYPLEFFPDDLKDTLEDENILLQFCKDHGIEHEEMPKWWLASLWN